MPIYVIATIKNEKGVIYNPIKNKKYWVTNVTKEAQGEVESKIYIKVQKVKSSQNILKEQGGETCLIKCQDLL